MAPRGWTTADDIAAVVRRRWDAGDLLVRAATTLPLTIPLRGPAPAELGQRLPEVQAWISALRQGSRAGGGRGYDLLTTPVTTRQLGTNEVPIAVSVPALDDALALIGRHDDHDRWCRLVAATNRICPALGPWVAAQPLAVLEYGPVWERVVQVAAWFQAHPRPGIYLRQIDLPGIDTKFIESCLPLLRRLLDAILLPTEIDADVVEFTRRYGVLRKPALLQVRILDPRLAIGGLTHLAAPFDQIAALDLPVRRVIITENEINGLTLPAMDDTVAIFGRGYAIDHLDRLPWVARSELRYWGDIDTHGFAILDRLRHHLPRARSLLMDETTLLAHREQWVEESEQTARDLTHLTTGEQSVFNGLVSQRWGCRLRLEQERIGFAWVKQAVAAQ